MEGSTKMAKNGVRNEEPDPSEPDPSEASTSFEEETSRPRVKSGTFERIVDEKFKLSVATYNNDALTESKIKALAEHALKKSKFFLKSASDSNIERTREILRNVSPRYKGKHQVLQRLIADWKPKRESVINQMAVYISNLDRNFKASTIVRLVSSLADISGSVGGLILDSESSWAKYALSSAPFFGLCGLISTVAEVDRSKRILDEVSEHIEKDHKLLLPIVQWFEETKELDLAVQDLFPHGIDKEIVQEIQDISVEQDNYLKCFKAGLLSNVRRDSALLSNRDFLHSLQLFARSEVAGLWWNRIIYRRHPISLDFCRMDLQNQYGQMQSILFQCIPALPLEQQRLASLPVAGRIMLNFLTLYDSLSDIRQGAKSLHSDKLRRQLEKMKEELEMIEDTVMMMGPRDE